MSASSAIYEEQANRLVDFVIDSAIKQLTGQRPITTGSAVRFDLSRESTIVFESDPPQIEEDYEIQNIEWLTIEEFSVNRAEEKIHEFIKTWDYQDSWLYCIDYVGEDEHQYDFRHRFRVRWSVPTRRKPIPRATACIYFTFEVSKIKPKDYPVQVFYVFEGNRLVHQPGHSRFREKWLKDIIESKVMLTEALAF